MFTKIIAIIGVAFSIAITGIIVLALVRGSSMPAQTVVYSQYGFSFDYLESLSIIEYGLSDKLRRGSSPDYPDYLYPPILEYIPITEYEPWGEPNENSGVIIVEDETQQLLSMFKLTWQHMDQNTFQAKGGEEYYLQQYVEGLLPGPWVGPWGTISNLRYAPGDLVESTYAGHRLVYQSYPQSYKYYVDSGTKDGTAYGIVAVFYCDSSERLFLLHTINLASSTEEDAVANFNNYLDTFVCH